MSQAYFKCPNTESPNSSFLVLLLLSILVSIGISLLITVDIYTVLFLTVVNHMGWKAIIVSQCKC